MRPGPDLSTVQAVVSRGGRPDLTDADLYKVHQLTLLIVGERHPVVIELNHEAMQKLGGETRLVIISGVSRLSDETGRLEQVAGLAQTGSPLSAAGVASWQGD
jgi:putative phosphoribosyl transferase